METRLIPCREFEPVSIPWIPKGSPARKYLDFRESDGRDRLIVAVQGHVGLLPLTKDHALLVRPKVELDDWLGFMLFADKQFVGAPGEGEVPAIRGMPTANSLLGMIALRFLGETEELVRKGLRKEYVLRDYNEAYLRGKLDVPRHIRQNYLQGRFDRLAFRGSELTHDALPNQVLKAALTVLLRLAWRQALPRNLFQQLTQALGWFESVSDARIDIRQIDYAIERLPPSSRHYKSALVMARVILLAQVPVLDGRPELVLPGFLFNMNDAFERFVRNSVRLGLADQAGIRVQNGNKAPRQLFENNADWTIKPDVIISASSQVLLLVDAKYKLEVKEEDIYQAISYLVSTGASQAVLIYPKVSGKVVTEYQLGGRSLLVHFADLADWRSASLEVQGLCRRLMGIDSPN